MFTKLDKKVFITSDTHYSHKNICRGTSTWEDKNYTRDFNTIEEMNNVIVNNINNVVGEDDILIHLGDWSFNGVENVFDFRYRLKCKEIYLVLGNHDHLIEADKESCRSLFEGVFDIFRINYEGHKIELSHYPFESWSKKNNGRIHLHGHTHLPNHLKIKNRRMDVGIDGHEEFRPYDLIEECIKPLLLNDI